MSNRTRYSLLAAVLALVVGAIVYLEGRPGGPGSVVGGPQAPELVGIANWINADPVTLEQLRGQVVLVDFWTYTCVNCIRTFPYLKEWHGKYADRGLVIIGVHTPEFNFEKNPQNVSTAVEEFDLPYAVAQDNDYRTWRAFQNRYWPAKYLIDKNGVIRYHHFGEGAYDETEQQIQTLLLELGQDLANVPINPDSGPERNSAALARDGTGLSRELYAGYDRNLFPRGGYVGNDEYYQQRNAAVEYQDPGEHENHFLYLQGWWFNGPESLRHARQTEGFEDYIAIKFYATSVNVVLTLESLAEDEGPIPVFLTLDGAPLTEETRGQDVVFGEGGESLILVDEPRMYRLVETPEFGGHELKLWVKSDRLGLFAFTFGAYDFGP